MQKAMESNDNNKLEELLRKMYAEENLYKKSTGADIVEEEWAEFERAHFHAAGGDLHVGGDLQSPTQQAKLLLRLRKIAAMFIGVLMLSGIAYAAICIVSQTPGAPPTAPGGASLPCNTFVSPSVDDMGASTMQPVVFEDAELETILREMAVFYQCETVYKNEKVKHVRLYFTWDKTAAIDDVIATFNKFERFHITQENRQLIVE